MLRPIRVLRGLTENTSIWRTKN